MAQNEDLPGVEGEGVSQQKKIKAIEDAFDDLLAHRRKRMEHGEKERDCQAVLVKLFRKHNVKCYFVDDVKYILRDKESIVKAPKDVDGEDAE